ncbi:carbamoyl phosphate synthase large subunit [Methyloceanibacter stevinii]|uniref:Carbamoyl phosphate synthase large chain n=1 Tax=Methyloceanibacter stevinii TaxID=1774970 RepID=A0A1E3VNQ4_9HYPH|nr:carbamoyl-phosphate synthase large subunit [Methyloceanibacter stevinii]ODR95154.1 carbamoyl phosphate synthase large subunit [Methyloceanibacter stevinii]
MPKRDDIKSILIIGAGPIVIGQACEFDYSGTQACKALKDEAYRIILVNSNPATIMTDPDLADATYIEPITPEFVARIIERERPDALLPTMGGQTALNTALSSRASGVLEKYGVEMIGAKADVIDKAEDRELFRKAMDKIGLESPKSRLADAGSLKRADRETYKAEVERIEAENSDPDARAEAMLEFEADWGRHETERRRRYVEKGLIEALEAMQDVGLPAIIRPSFTLGGTGGGIAYNREEFLEIVERGLDASPTCEVLIEESVLGWKEYEMEVVRDKDDNCIIICSIENIDPMGVHTGDSITVAPALTLTDKEYQIMRDASIAVLREIGVETGGSNVQFAVNPEDGRLIVIEMNPRVSRSSALASKATGFPIAKIAAKLAVGYTLDELENDITGGATPASFEPTIDYVVTKIPRFAFEKFQGSAPTLTTAMKSVGEAMAIGRTFPESLQKALRSLETGLTGLDEFHFEGLGQGDDKNVIREALGSPTPDRLLKVAQALRLGVDHEQIYDSCRIDPWFIRQLQDIIDTETRVREHGLPQTPGAFRALKAMGFSDDRLASLAGLTPAEVRRARHALHVHPVYKRIDTCAAEFASPTAYMYSTYETGFTSGESCEARPSAADKIIILGGGPNRIGQGIEFDYCCCHAAFALSAAGFETIMVNCNPETVSTDYDTSDRLYFEPLTEEDVLEIVQKEQTNGAVKGVIVQFGGQTPLKLAAALEDAQIPILGTSPDAIDLAEDRDRFKALIDQLGLRQPKNGIARSAEEAIAIAKRIGFPVVIRPSYVLGGRAMEIVHEEAQLERYIAEAVVVSGKSPVLLDSYLRDAIEVDVDALADGRDVFICGVMEHIEEAGVHSGDSACSLPPHSLKPAIIAELERQARELARALSVVGLMNIQFAIQNDDIYILEVNPRASRTVPFVAKVIGKPIAGIASEVMAGKPLKDFGLTPAKLDHIAVKEAVFPFARFPGVDPVLGPEMRSTGEVMGLDRDYAVAFAKSQLGGGAKLPLSGTVFVSVKDLDKDKLLAPVRTMIEMGFRIVATRGTQRHLAAHGIACERVNKVLEGRPHIVDAITNGDIDIVFNTTEGAKALADSMSIRRSALLNHIPYYTTLAGALAATEAIRALRAGSLTVAPLQSYVG